MDEPVALEKVYWKDVRDRVSKVNPRFAELVDDLDPDESFPLYIAKFPYGAIEGDSESTFVPDNSGGFQRLSDPNLPKDILKHLGYGRASAPLSMVLENSFELFVDLPNEGITIPRLIYKPGEISPFSYILNVKNQRQYAPTGILTLAAGARSTFMLPNIGCAFNHSKLQLEYGIKSSAPKSLTQHWNLFKDLAHSPAIKSDWRATMLYFSEKWFKTLHSDNAWTFLKLFLHELAWLHYDYQRNHLHYDTIFSLIQKRRNLKPNPYLADTARHLFTIALGAAPGYIPMFDDEFGPFSLLQQAFINGYDMKKFTPAIMGPASFHFETAQLPIYYSLQYPSTFIFSPKSRKLSSTLSELRQLEHILKTFISELSKDDPLYSGSIINTMAKSIKFSLYHNEYDRYKIVCSSKEIEEKDSRFLSLMSGNKSHNGKFASDARFLRGCIGIERA